MQWLIELIAGVIALMAASAFNQLGIEFTAPSHGEREVHRIDADCAGERPTAMIAAHRREC